MPPIASTGRRAENVALCQQLRTEGLNTRQIADRVGLSWSTVRNYLSDPDGSQQKRNRARYAGRCRICGEPTTGCEGRGKAPSRCVQHANEEIARAKIGTGPAQARTLALIASGTDRYMAIARALGKPDGWMGEHLNRLMRHGLIERVERGRYRVVSPPPSFRGRA